LFFLLVFFSLSDLRFFFFFCTSFPKTFGKSFIKFAEAFSKLHKLDSSFLAPPAYARADPRSCAATGYAIDTAIAAIAGIRVSIEYPQLDSSDYLRY